METDRKSAAAMAGVAILFFGGFALFAVLFATQPTGWIVFFPLGLFLLAASSVFGGLAVWFGLRNIADVIIDARQCEFPKAANDG